ncbi:hypothetical protein NPIL_681861 [Nephila pilipes]|uniref:Granulins domain-containing protein n=1 Tax=Nephila pilipes TaxID=299642 RepID=A0A8X6PXS6_NEPPI|nr:hypothetical protein NPIL_681861 [Nephila pilipes]
MCYSGIIFRTRSVETHKDLLISWNSLRIVSEKMNLLSALALISYITVVFGDCESNSCEPHETCCPGDEPGEHSCCQFPNASCCPDMEFCCPEGTVCEPDTNSCVTETERSGLPLDDVYTDSPLVVKCDRQSYCFDSPCCARGNGQYGCCPFEEGVCCWDKKHCCPSDERCDETSMFCIDEVGNYSPASPHKPTLRKIPGALLL